LPKSDNKRGSFPRFSPKPDADAGSNLKTDPGTNGDARYAAEHEESSCMVNPTWKFRWGDSLLISNGGQSAAFTVSVKNSIAAHYQLWHTIKYLNQYLKEY